MPGSEYPGREGSLLAYLALGLLFALLVAIFAVQNAAAVKITFLLWSAQVPLALVIVGSVVVGAAVMALLSLAREYRLRRRGTIPPRSPQEPPPGDG